MEKLTKYVNPNIGTIGHLLQATAPTVMYPHGMMQISPDFNSVNGDRYLADRIKCFPVGPVAIMPTKGNLDTGSDFDHDLETSCPHMYSVYLETQKIQATYSVTEHCAIFEFDFFEKSENVENHVIMIAQGVKAVSCEDKIMKTKGRYFNIDAYALCEFSEKPKSIAGIRENTYKLSFGSAKIQVKIGISFIDSEQAEYNLNKEIPHFDINKIIEDGENKWDVELNKIKVKGAENDKRIFYTALYRSLQRPYNLSEYGRYYSNYDGKIHEDNGSEFYCGDGLWDTFRCLHPLQLILEPETHKSVLASYIRMYEQSGLMPNFPFPQGDRAFMIGFHSASLFADAYVKNIEFDIEKAYEGVRKNVFERSMLPWVNAPATELDEIYYKNGFFPALAPGQSEFVKEAHKFEGRQAVSVTLEHSYTDWCAYILAKALGKEQDAEVLLKRSQNYKNVFNRETKFMAPKTADGRFIEDFNPKLSGGQGGRLYFSENNSWTYTFSVFHDIDGLIELFGGKDEFADRLGRLFTESPGTSKYDFLKQFPDSTGLMGQYTMGNEPAFHIPYLFNYTGNSCKTQRKIHEIIRLWFTDHPLGICGDEDGGAMSSWLVFSAMGFYPVCPGKPVYDLGSPIFDEIIIAADKADLTIKADGASGRAKYIKSAYLDGKSINLEHPVIKHEDLYKSAVLNLEMSKYN
ncbi:MAG: GH92 family glycosyl hydrolase [Oscillospiraceae bacterium]|nr:GH92 family glycosyl hydrolase [Oscillospiraceae bacterium]